MCSPVDLGGYIGWVRASSHDRLQNEVIKANKLRVLEVVSACYLLSPQEGVPEVRTSHVLSLVLKIVLFDEAFISPFP